MSAARDEYEKKITSRSSSSEPFNTKDELKRTGMEVGSQMASQSASQGSVAGTVGGAAMMSGNPYLMAGGLGLQVLAAGEQNKRAQEEAQRQAYNQRIAERQMMMHQIASQGIQ